MITILAHTFNVLANVAQYLLQLASFVGQVIVFVITSAINFVLNSVSNASLFLQIVYEDNVFIFTEELPTWTSRYFQIICTQYYYVLNCIGLMCSELYFTISSVMTTVTYSFDTLLTILLDIMFVFKKSILIIGEALWLILTFLPIQLPYLIKIFMKHIKESVTSITFDLYKILLKLTNFLSDVPLESFLGIMTAIAIIRFYISFRIEIQTELLKLYWIVVRKIWYFYHSVYNYFTDSDIGIITRVANGEALMTRSASLDDSIDEVANTSDASCVICQERQKCVLILPCKHVCLCRECCVRLYGYQRTCPICRTFIYHSVTIYL